MSSQEMCDLRIVNERLKRLDEASREGDINKLKQLMDENPSLLDAFDHLVPAHNNPLHIAASHGHVDFTIEVLRLRPQLAELPDREGRLPLHLAAAKGHLQVIDKLVDQQDCQKFYLWKERKYGYLPVHIAAKNGHHTIVEMLVERCKEVLDHKTTNTNETLLHLAVAATCLESVHFLINRGVKLNEKDFNGNTCLHLACQNRSLQVITILLDQEGIDVNSTNKRGLTPLDELQVSSLYPAAEVALMSMLRRAGGKETTELGMLKRKKHRAEKPSDAKTLLLVATLVATMTFPGVLNPPGGFIQLPYDQSDARNSTFYDNWYANEFPAGRPALLWQLQAFFVLDSVALFSSISVILFLLCGIPQTKIIMKFLMAVLWLAALCTALAFASAFIVFYIPADYSFLPETNGNLDENATIFSWLKRMDEYIHRVSWLKGLLIAWCALFMIACLWASFQMTRFFWRIGGFKRKLPNWINKFGWPKNKSFRKIASIIFMVCLLAIISFSIYLLWEFGQYSVDYIFYVFY